jgi:hypothetical protein
MRTTKRNEINITYEIVDNPRLDALYERCKNSFNPRSAYARELRKCVINEIRHMFADHAQFVHFDVDAHEYPSTHVASFIVRA